MAELPRRSYSVEEVREIAYQAAGAASVPFMRADPDIVMPTEELEEAVEIVLASFGAEKPEERS